MSHFQPPGRCNRKAVVLVAGDPFCLECLQWVWKDWPEQEATLPHRQLLCICMRVDHARDPDHAAMYQERYGQLPECCWMPTPRNKEPSDG